MTGSSVVLMSIILVTSSLPYCMIERSVPGLMSIVVFIIITQRGRDGEHTMVGQFAQKCIDDESERCVRPTDFIISFSVSLRAR